jgi:predicted glutamine amidotransferase
MSTIMKHRSTRLLVFFLIITGGFMVFSIDTPPAPIYRTHNCRFWGIIYEERTQLVQKTIETHLDSLQSLGAHHDDGWGVAYYIDIGTHTTLPVVERGEPEAPDDPRFTRARNHATLYAGSGAIAHIRNASSGPTSGIPDPHPFSRYSAYRTYHMFFAHNGTMDPDMLLNLIHNANPNYMTMNPPDYTPEFLDSDLYALFIIEMIDMNSDKSIEECIRLAVTAIDSACYTGSAQCNFVMFDGNTLYAVNYSRSPIDALSLYLYAPQGRTDFWAIASEPLDNLQQHWIAVPNSTLVVLKPHTTPRLLDVLVEKTGNTGKPGIDAVYPNPMKPPVAITFTLPDHQPANRTHHVDIFNSAGQLVRTLHAHVNDRSNPNSVIWYGMDNQGQQAPNGVYYCCLSTADTIYTTKIVYIRQAP